MKNIVPNDVIQSKRMCEPIPIAANRHEVTEAGAPEDEPGDHRDAEREERQIDEGVAPAPVISKVVEPPVQEQKVEIRDHPARKPIQSAARAPERAVAPRVRIEPANPWERVSNTVASATLRFAPAPATRGSSLPSVGRLLASRAERPQWSEITPSLFGGGPVESSYRFRLEALCCDAGPDSVRQPIQVCSCRADDKGREESKDAGPTTCHLPPATCDLRSREFSCPYNSDMNSVLLIDDNGLFRAVSEDIERRTRCRVFRADNGTEALAAARREKPDLIFVDAEMSGMTASTCAAC